MFKVYSKDNCQGCTGTYRVLDKVDANYEPLDILDPVVADSVAHYGYMQAPIVEYVDKDSGKVLDSWYGFRPDKLMEYAA